MTMLDLSRKHDRATELRAIADGRLLLNVRNGVTVSRSMLAKIADELEAERAAHAETKRERDEAFQKYVDANEARIEAEAHLAEALKALEPFAEASRWFDEATAHFGVALTPDQDAAGYRILGPGELDPETVERCAEVAENASIRVSYGILSQERNEPILHRTVIATSIRALAKEKQG